MFELMRAYQVKLACLSVGAFGATLGRLFQGMGTLDTVTFNVHEDPMTIQRPSNELYLITWRGRTLSLLRVFTEFYAAGVGRAEGSVCMSLLGGGGWSDRYLVNVEAQKRHAKRVRAWLRKHAECTLECRDA